MKIKYSLLVFLAIIITSCSNEKIENDWTRLDLKDKVMSYSEICYRAESHFGKIEKGKRERWSFYGLDEYREFDEKGNLIELKAFRSNGNLTSKSTFKYDDKGNRIEENSYNSEGNLTKKWTYKHDEKGNKIERKIYDSEGVLNFKVDFDYDENGNLLEENSYDSKDTYNGKITYQYDKKENVIERNNYDSEGALNFKDNFDYNENGQMVEENSYISEDLDSKTTYMYDNKGNNIERISYNSDGRLDSKITYKHDDKGNIIEYNFYNSDGSLNKKRTHQYEYDKKGNWLREIISIDEKSTYILEREYEYFDAIKKEKATQSNQIQINYNETEEFTGRDNIYKFKAPKGLFTRVDNDVFMSQLLKATIKFTAFRFDQFDQFDQQGKYSKSSFINKYKNTINTSYELDKNDWFILSGLNTNNEIVYMKGFYEELESMQGRNYGEPTWLWSKVGVIEIYYPEDSKEEFDKLIPLIIKSFKCDFSFL